MLKKSKDYNNLTFLFVRSIEIHFCHQQYNKQIECILRVPTVHNDQLFDHLVFLPNDPLKRQTFHHQHNIETYNQSVKAYKILRNEFPNNDPTI